MKTDILGASGLLLLDLSPCLLLLCSMLALIGKPLTSDLSVADDEKELDLGRCRFFLFDVLCLLRAATGAIGPTVVLTVLDTNGADNDATLLLDIDDMVNGL